MSGNGEEENGLIVLKHAAETKKVLSFHQAGGLPAD